MQVRKLSKNERGKGQVKWQVGESSFFPIKFNFSAFMAFGWFGGIFFLYWIYQFTNISFTDILKWFAMFSLILTIIPYKWVLKFLTIEYAHLIALNIIGFGPLLTGLYLFINMVLANHPTTTTYAIESSGMSMRPFENHYMVVKLKDNALQEETRFRRFDQVYLLDFRNSDSITYIISKGFFGYDVLVDYELVPKARN